MRGIVGKALALGAVAVVAAACGGSEDLLSAGDGTSVARGSSSVTRAASTPPLASVAPQLPPPDTSGLAGVTARVPVPGPPPEAEPALATIVLTTITLSGAAVADVPVHVSQREPCAAANRDIPVGSVEVSRQVGTTDMNGRTTFAAPVGCYYFGMAPPPGTSPVPEGMHSLFITEPGQIVTGALRFNDPNQPSCTAAAIVNDLDVGGRLADAQAAVRECAGRWAVIVWDIPGDSQRIVVHNASRGWTTFVSFPHEMCWSYAAEQGVPERLRGYFLSC